VPISRGLVVVLAAIALCVPGAAYAQTTTLPTTGSGVSKRPPVPLAQSHPKDPAPSPPSTPKPAPSATPPSIPEPAPGATPAVALPNTGADPRLLLLMGAALTLIGAGLRLQTADGEHY
jgi:LPXTG-motif cell wall-anchored protein